MALSALAPVERRGLHEELTEQLRRAIIHGELEAGTKISEKALCEQFGVSRTPVREAIKILSTEGLIQLNQNRGASVTELTLSDLKDAFPIMATLEGLAGQLACKNASDAQIARASALQTRLEAMFKSGDRKGYFKVNEDIHELFIEASGNAALPRLIRAVSAQVRRARYMANLSTDRWEQAVKEHADILVAFEARDANRVGRLMTTHLNNKLKALTKALEGQV
ncbi:MAG: GntR family transcriptional regulator [Pseudomonadota bacterium]